MSVREEDKQKNCPSRGLGLAAAAIGVGVGAALYYFFSKRPENPDAEGSTSGSWGCEEPQALFTNQPKDESNDSYTTISEHTTTDTSINSSSNMGQCASFQSRNNSFESLESFEEYVNNGSQNSSIISITSEDNNADSNEDISMDSEDNEFFENELYICPESGDVSAHSESDMIISASDNEEDETESFSESSFITISTDSTDSDSTDWVTDVTENSLHVHVSSYVSRPQIVWTRLHRLLNLFSPVPSRERRWSLEECAICFEVMLKDQELFALPCTHSFHAPCIGPWLQQQQTCPVCRKPAE